jgi:hypothetical protein
MLQTIEVEIDNNGVIHPIELSTKLPAGRALLTLLEPIAPKTVAEGFNMSWQEMLRGECYPINTLWDDLD